jgi:methionyl-tRNA formyltransferase
MSRIISANPSQFKYLVAGYGLPAEYGIATLFGYGCKPNQIRLLTHKADERNTGLVEMAKLRNLQYQTSSPKDNEIVEWVEEFKPDIILSLHYRSLIPGRILNAAKMGSVNLHPSLLPKYRGANSVAWAIINGEMRTGFSFHHMTECFDAGRILIQEEIDITPTDTAFSLFHRQIACAMKRLDEVIVMVSSNVSGLEQVGESSYYGRDLPFSGIINPAWGVEKIDRFIRAMYFPPFKPAVVKFNSKLLPIHNMEEYRSITSQV